MKKFLKIVGIVLILGVFGYGGYVWRARYTHPRVQYKTAAESDAYVRFDMEAYDSILQNYWKQATSSDMAGLFQLSLQKAANLPSLPSLQSQDRTGTANMLAAEFKTVASPDAKKQLTLGVLNVVLYNLPPVGRDELLSSVQETELRQTVANVNPSNDLYQNLGVERGASVSEIDKAFAKKKAELSRATTTAAKAELAAVSYAHEVLTNPTDKTTYDTTQVEPTVFAHIMSNTLYLYIDKISPTTLSEFVRAVDSASTTPKLSSMILDLRGNIGGDLTFPQYFLGLFLGPNQYAFDLFHQGNYEVERTVTPQFTELGRYTEYAILTDGQTQSTAELLTSILKKFHIARSVGIKTRGWGSVENTYPIQTVIDPKEKYSLLLVNSLTLGVDEQPIEINGVSPDVDTGAKNWKDKLPGYFHSAGLIQALGKTAAAPPMR